MISRIRDCSCFATFNPKPVKNMREPLPVLGDNTTLGNMDWVIGYSCAGLGNGEVVVIFGGIVVGSTGIILLYGSEVIGYSYTGIGSGEVVAI